MHHYKFWLSLIFHVILCGCNVCPHYETPFVEIPSTWHSPISEEMQAFSPDCFLWWENFNDPILNDLMYKASLQNLDLAIAAMRILESRALEKGGYAGLYPHLDGSLTYGHAQFNQKMLNHLFGTSKHRHRRNLNFFEAGFDADWEIDLFGKSQHDIAALKAKIEASEADYSHLWITLSAEVARNYVELRGSQLRLQVITQEIEGQKETVHLIESLIKAGFAGTVEQRLAQEQLSALQAEKPLLELAVSKAIHRLSILLGYAPGDLFCLLEEPQPLPVLPDQTPLGIPSELLRRRPDIRKAERDLAAATELVGSAIASLFPRLSLKGFIGEIRALHTSSFTWFAAPQLLLPIFNSTLLEQDVSLNKIKAEEAFYAYQKVVLEALEEAENSISALHHERERNYHLEQASTASQEAYILTYEFYQRGLKDYLAVLETKRSHWAAENAFLQSQTDLLLNYISLYKALGGGIE